MKIVIQRVNSASVAVDGTTVTSIKHGLLLLLGIDRNDTRETMGKTIQKVLKLHVWDCEETGKMWKKSVVDMDYEVLIQSQFTLHAVLSKGNKPDFHIAMKSDQAREEYEYCLSVFRSLYNPERIKTGIFGGYSQVSLENDGPCTFILE